MSSTKSATLEHIPPDYGFQRHFTCAQSRLYINDIFIDEFNHIQWELQFNLIPKFGYCSAKFDDVAQGKSLVQGQLAINFVSPGYLIGALIGKTATSTGAASSSASSERDCTISPSENPNNQGFPSPRDAAASPRISPRYAPPRPQAAG